MRISLGWQIHDVEQNSLRLNQNVYILLKKRNNIPYFNHDDNVLKH